ncbi:MAG: flagellar motor protein MotB [Eubacteriales bacterium]|nr:flagellar motor protein MotB [Eubacteriales bacterium]
MKRSRPEGPKIDKDRWMTTYCDLMNNLLVFFIMLYMMSVLDLNKFNVIIASFTQTFRPDEVREVSIPDDITSFFLPENTVSDSGGPSDDDTSDPDEYSLDDLDEFVRKISMLIKEHGFSDDITVEKVDEYVYFRITEGVLFYPNQAVLKQSSYKALEFISEILYEVYPEISTIEIAGHTAYVPNDEDPNEFSSWDLSAERSLTVLKYLVRECGLPKTKMIIMGFSSTQPYTEGKTEAEKALNRRVELRISRLIDEETGND